MAWRGRITFGDLWAAYEGTTDQNAPHAHSALQIAVGIDEPVTVRHERQTVTAPAVLVQPLAEHTVAPNVASVVFLYVEARAPLGRALRAARTAVVAAAPDVVATTVHDAVDAAAAIANLERRLAIVTPPLDPRLVRTLDALSVSDASPTTLAATARAIGLSAPRLRAVARRELGVPLARWLLWRKLARAAQAIAAGASLAIAAAEAGFADQAHLTRTMRRMFGVTPSTATAALR